MSTSQDYPNSTPTPATTTTGEGQRRGRVCGIFPSRN